MVNYTIKSRTRHLNVTFYGMDFSEPPEYFGRTHDEIFRRWENSKSKLPQDLANVLRQLFFAEIF